MSKRARSKTVCVSRLLYGCAFALALSTSSGFSQTNEVIPPLHPPRPEIPPGFWEQNGYHMYGDPFKEQRFDTE